MNNGRRVELDVTYNNAPFAGQVGAEIESLTYVDNAADDSDSIDITLDAQDGKWLHGWLPEEGATLRPRIIGRDWNGPGDTHVMECGLFILDDVDYQDAPTTLQVGGVSKPSDTDFSELERETIWKNTSIKRIGESIAGRYGLGFTYDADDYDIECDEQDGTDSSYYNTLCKNYGLILKVYAKRLWVYDRERYKGNVTDTTEEHPAIIYSPAEMERRLITAKRWSAHLESLSYMVRHTLATGCRVDKWAYTVPECGTIYCGVWWMPATLGYTAHHALLTGGQPGAFAVSPEFTGTLPVPATVGYSVCGALRSGGVATGYTASPEFAGTLPEEAQHGN